MTKINYDLFWSRIFKNDADKKKDVLKLYILQKLN